MLKFPKITVLKISRYTIVEMMMVVAVFMIILSMAMAAWLNSNSDAQLRNAARLIKSQLDTARAQAVATRKSVGVCFVIDDNTNSNKPYKFSMLLCEDGDPAKPIAGENWVRLPGGTIVTSEKLDFDATAVDGEDDKIVFNYKGQASTDKFTLTDGEYAIYVTGISGKKDSTGKFIIIRDEPFYEIKINKFTGRSNTKFYEVED